MSEITTTELIERLRVQVIELRVLMADCHNSLPRDNEATELVAKAADLVREATRCVEYPDVRRVNCVWIGEKLHALRGNFHAVCGTAINGNATFLTRLTVPDCELCIAVLASQKELLTRFGDAGDSDSRKR